MTLYRIRDWNTEFENNRSRTVDNLTWVAMPNRWDGEHYVSIITSKDGAEIFSAWVLIVQVASRCQPRGTLLRGTGKPHDSTSLSLKTRAPKSWFDKALKFLTENTDWLEIEELASGCHPPDANLTPTCQSGDEGRKEGRNGKERRLDASTAAMPEALNSEPFLTMWAKWLDHLKQKRKPATLHAQELQLAKLADMGIPKAIHTLSNCIEKNWQGVYEPKLELNLGQAPRPVGFD